MLIQSFMAQFDLWHQKIDKQKSDSGIQLGECVTFSLAHPLRVGWTRLKKVLDFILSRKVFSKLFLTIWIWYRSCKESAVSAQVQNENGRTKWSWAGENRLPFPFLGRVGHLLAFSKAWTMPAPLSPCSFPQSILLDFCLLSTLEITKIPGFSTATQS